MRTYNLIIDYTTPPITASACAASVLVGVITRTSNMVRWCTSMWHTARAALMLKGSVLARTAKAPLARSA
jgi:hypothetical protein